MSWTGRRWGPAGARGLRAAPRERAGQRPLSLRTIGAAHAREAPGAAHPHAHPDPLRLSRVEPVEGAVSGGDLLRANSHVPGVRVVGMARGRIHQVCEQIPQGRAKLLCGLHPNRVFPPT